MQWCESVSSVFIDDSVGGRRVVTMCSYIIFVLFCYVVFATCVLLLCCFCIVYCCSCKNLNLAALLSKRTFSGHCKTTVPMVLISYRLRYGFADVTGLL